MVLPPKLKSKKAILNIQNRDNQCLRWALQAALFPAPRGRNPVRPSSYPTEDGLNFSGIDFPTLVSQIDGPERQNQNLAINVFIWENGQVTFHRISEKGGEIPRINLVNDNKAMGINTNYRYVKRLTALLYDQNRYNESKHFCESCLHGYQTRDLLERHKPECKGLLKSSTKTEMPKEGENEMSFTNFYKQMKAPYVVYADFECVLRKISSCKPDNKHSFTVKTEKHEPCGFSYMIVRIDGQSFGPFKYRGEDSVFVFLVWLQHHEREMREDMVNKRPLVNGMCGLCFAFSLFFLVLSVTRRRPLLSQVLVGTFETLIHENVTHNVFAIVCEIYFLLVLSKCSIGTCQNMQGLRHL